MLLGDRSFVERDRVVDFQKTGVYHVLVLAGLHVGALAAFFLWAGRRLHLGLSPRILLTLLRLPRMRVSSRIAHRLFAPS